MLLYGLILKNIDNVIRSFEDRGLNINGNVFKDHVNSCEVFEVSNVGKYVFEVSDKEEYDADDYPNVRLPFDFMWLERGPVEFMRVNNEVVKMNPNHAGSVRFGNLMIQDKRGDHFLINILSFNEYRKSVVVHPWVYSFEIDASGKIIKHGDNWLAVISGQNTPKEILEDYQAAFTAACCYALLSVSFMHCKNVVVKKLYTNRISNRTKNNPPSIKYHILEIEPMKHILKCEGNVDKTGLHHALHICRGHFKDYNEHGLFGKYKGMYWWDSHVRGDPSRGAVVKDYNVNAPNA